MASNYRLGAAGWVSAPGEDMTPNVGLWDAHAALEWTQKYIHNFGGDPDRITVMGESAGAAIAQHLITSRGGKGKPPPFKRVSEPLLYQPPSPLLSDHICRLLV